MPPTDDGDSNGADPAGRIRDEPDSLDRDAIADGVTGDADARLAAADALGALAVGADVDDDAVDALGRLLRDDDPKVRNAATVAAGQFALAAPGAVGPLVPALVERLDDGPSIRHNALEALASVPPAESDALAPAVPKLEPSLRSQFVVVRDSALSILAAATRAAPDEAASLLPPVLDCLAETADDHDADVAGVVDGDDVRTELAQGANEVRLRTEETRANAVGVLAAVADERPDAVADVVPRLASILAAETVVPARVGVVDVLATVAAERPDAVRPLADDLASVLRDGATPELRATAARALSTVAEAYPGAVADAVRPAADSLPELLDGDSAYVRACAAGLVSYVADVAPESVGAAVDPLVERLADDRATVRGSAALALGAIGAGRAVDALRELEADDPDPDVRAAASSAVAAIEAGQH